MRHDHVLGSEVRLISPRDDVTVLDNRVSALATTKTRFLAELPGDGCRRATRHKIFQYQLVPRFATLSACTLASRWWKSVEWGARPKANLAQSLAG
jgi:hypothetical protein